MTTDTELAEAQEHLDAVGFARYYEVWFDDATGDWRVGRAVCWVRQVVADRRERAA